MLDPFASTLRHSLRAEPGAWEIDLEARALVHEIKEVSPLKGVMVTLDGREVALGASLIRFRFIDAWLNRCAILQWIEDHAG